MDGRSGPAENVAMGDLRWSDEHLEPLRAVGDPEADRVVADLFSRGEDVVRAVNTLMRELVENADVPARALPESARAYFLGEHTWAI